MSDLASLMQQGPAGGFMAGQQNVADLAQKDAETQRLAQLVQELQIKNQQSQLTNPLELDKLRLGNETLSAELPGHVADSSSKQSKASLEAQTLPSSVQAKIAENAGTVDKEQQAKRDRFTTFLTTTGPKLDGLPKPLQLSALRNEMVAAGYDPNSPESRQWLQHLQTMPNVSKELARVANKIGATKASQDPGYHQAVDVEGMKAASALAVEEKRLEGVKYTADKSADARIGAAKARSSPTDFWANYYKIKGSAFAQYNALTSEATKLMQTGDEHDKAEALKMLQMRAALKAAAETELANKRPPTADMEKLGVQTTPPPSLDGSTDGESLLHPAGQGQAAAPKIGQTKGGTKFKITPTN